MIRRSSADLPLTLVTARLQLRHPPLADPVLNEARKRTQLDQYNPGQRDEELTICATGLGPTIGGRVTAGVPAG